MTLCWPVISHSFSRPTTALRKTLVRWWAGSRRARNLWLGDSTSAGGAFMGRSARADADASNNAITLALAGQAIWLDHGLERRPGHQAFERVAKQAKVTRAQARANVHQAG